MRHYKLIIFLSLGVCLQPIYIKNCLGISGKNDPWDYTKEIDGYVITQSNDTLYGKIRMYDEVKSAYAVDYNKKLLTPYEIKEYGFLDFKFDRIFLSDYSDSIFTYRKRVIGERIRVNILNEQGIHMFIPHEILLVDGKEFNYNSNLINLYQVDKVPKQWYNGFIVKNNSDTLYGMIEFKGLLKNQKSVNFKSDSFVVEYFPNQLLGYTFHNIEVISYKIESGICEFQYVVVPGRLEMRANFEFSPDILGFIGTAVGIAASSVTGFGIISLPNPKKYPNIFLERDSTSVFLDFNKIIFNNDEQINKIVDFYPEYFNHMTLYELERFVILYNLVKFK